MLRKILKFVNAIVLTIMLIVIMSYVALVSWERGNVGTLAFSVFVICFFASALVTLFTNKKD